MREPWPAPVKKVANVVSGVCVTCLGLLFWPPTNWKLWVFIGLSITVIAIQETLAEGQND